jgi:Skp family chaperone for outer membrane proteins
LVIEGEAMKSYQNAIDSFDLNQRVQELLSLKSFDSETSERKLLVRYATVCDEFEHVDAQRNYILDYWQMQVDRHGPTPPGPDRVDRFGYAFYLIPMLYDASLLSEFFISDGYGLVSAYGMAVALSVGIATACHYGGKAIVNRKLWPAVICFGFVLALAGVIFGMRSGIDKAIFNVAAMILLNGIGSLITYRNTSRKVRFKAREMFNRVNPRYHELLAEKTDLEKQLDNPSAYAEDQARREATEELNELETNRDQHQYNVVYLESRINEIQTKNDDIKLWGVDRMRLAQAKGIRKRERFLLPKVRTIILVLVTMAAMLLGSCADTTNEGIPQNADTFAIDVYIDKSISMTPIDSIQADALKLYLKTVLDLDNPRRVRRHWAKVRFIEIGSKIIAEDKTIELPLSRSIATRNVPKQKATLDSISDVIDRLVDEVIFSPNGNGWTNISETVGLGLKEQASLKCSRRINIVITDCLESNPEIDLGKMDRGEIERKRDEILAILERQLPLPRLDGIEILLVALSKDDFDSKECLENGRRHTVNCTASNARQVYAASEIFKERWRGANVKVKGSL